MQAIALKPRLIYQIALYLIGIMFVLIIYIYEKDGRINFNNYI